MKRRLVKGRKVGTLTEILQMTPAEVAELLKAFDSPDTAYANGLKINGEKYTVIQVLDNVVRTKKVSQSPHKYGRPDLIVNAGQRRTRRRKDSAGPHHRSPPRDRPHKLVFGNSGAIGGVLEGCGLLRGGRDV